VRCLTMISLPQPRRRENDQMTNPTSPGGAGEALAKKDSIEQLAELLHEVGAQVQIGLRAQGKMPVVTRMLMDGATWKDIGAKIGWCPDTARDWYAREAAASLSPQPAPEQGGL
jgi:hypothetical protein